MTATQSLQIYEILHRYFKNDADAKTVVHEIESIVDSKFENEKNRLSSKEDIHLLRQDFLKPQIEVEKRFNTQTYWIVGTGLGIIGMIFTMIKLFLVK